MNPAPVAARNPLDQETKGQVWSLCMIGLCVFTISVVTARVPLADVGVVIGVLGILLQTEKLRFPRPAWLLAMFVLWALSTALISEYMGLALGQSIEILKLLVVLVVAINALRSEQQIRVYVYIYLVCFALQPARTALQGYEGGNTTFGRAFGAGYYGNPNDLASLTLLAIGFALALATSVRERTAIRIIAWICIVWFAVIIILTQSRGVVLGAMIGFGPALVVILVRRPSRAIYASIVVAVLLLVAPSSAWERLAGMSNLTSTSTVAQADPEGSAAKRLEVQKAALEMSLARPVFGTGIGTFSSVLERDFPDLGRTDAHSTYLRLSAELGIPGLILWCAMIWSTLAVARRGRLSAGEAGLAINQVWIERAVVGYLVAGLFGTYWLVSYIYLYLGVLWCRGTILLEASASKRESPDSG